MRLFPSPAGGTHRGPCTAHLRTLVPKTILYQVLFLEPESLNGQHMDSLRQESQLKPAVPYNFQLPICPEVASDSTAQHATALFISMPMPCRKPPARTCLGTSSTAQRLALPKGPGTTIVQTYTSKSLYSHFCKAQVCTIQLHGPFGSC